MTTLPANYDIIGLPRQGNTVIMRQHGNHESHNKISSCAQKALAQSNRLPGEVVGSLSKRLLLKVVCDG